MSDPAVALPIALGRRLRQLRRDRAWRQADLAARVGISVSTLRLYGHGHPPRLAVLMRLSEQLGLTLDDLVNGCEANPCRLAVLRRLPACEALPPYLADLLLKLIDFVLTLHRVPRERAAQLISCAPARASVQP
jgi:transcriptional regulator with XRE-family HTH domain